MGKREGRLEGDRTDRKGKVEAGREERGETCKNDIYIYSILFKLPEIYYMYWWRIK